PSNQSFLPAILTHRTRADMHTTASRLLDGHPGMSSHELQTVIDTIYQRYRSSTEGEVATYIPELGKADPDAFGICLVTADGRMFETGDSELPFTIQSMSKPLTFGMALEEFGDERVAQQVG